MDSIDGGGCLLQCSAGCSGSQSEDKTSTHWGAHKMAHKSRWGAQCMGWGLWGTSWGGRMPCPRASTGKPRSGRDTQSCLWGKMSNLAALPREKSRIIAVYKYAKGWHKDGSKLQFLLPGEGATRNGFELKQGAWTSDVTRIFQGKRNS